jgi:hypothetical protein
MRRLPVLLLALAASAVPVRAQRHSGITSPPTAPPPPQAAPPPAAPIVPVSSGLGPLVFTQANAPEPAPESLVAQLQADDDRIRAAALSAIGAPSAYIAREHAPLPHSVQINYVALGSSGELDAIMTVELDLHLVSAILVPSGSSWRRVATVTYATNFADPTTNLGTFLRTVRSLIGPDHYTAIFRGVSVTPDGDLTEHEAHLNIFNGHAAITISFASAERVCETPHLQPRTPHGDCDLTERWLQGEPAQGDSAAILVTATGRVGVHDAIDPVSRMRLFDFAHTRNYECQPYEFDDDTSHYEPTANSAPCFESVKPPAAPPAATTKPSQPAPAKPDKPATAAPQAGGAAPERQFRHPVSSS